MHPYDHHALSELSQRDARDGETAGPEPLARSRGLGVGETLLLAALAAAAVTAGTARLVPGAGTRETARGAAASLHTFFQLARVEAIARDRPVRLALDPSERQVSVLDTLGTRVPDDDLELHRAVLPAGIALSAPDGEHGAALVEFRPDGTADAAAVPLNDGAVFQRVAVDGASRIRVEEWDGAAWSPRR
jgi:hypothetical protein